MEKSGIVSTQSHPCNITPISNPFHNNACSSNPYLPEIRFIIVCIIWSCLQLKWRYVQVKLQHSHYVHTKPWNSYESRRSMINKTQHRVVTIQLWHGFFICWVKSPYAPQIASYFLEKLTLSCKQCEVINKNHKILAVQWHCDTFYGLT